MKINSTLVCIAFAIASFLFLSSCSGDVAEQKPQYDYQRDDSLPPDYLRELGNFRVGMEQIASMNESIMLEKNSYNSQLLNPASKISGYNNSKIQAVNLGVYASDLSYAAAFHQTQDMRNYMDAIFQIATKLGIQSAFDKELLEKLTSADTTIDKAQLFSRAFRQLQENTHSHERSHLMALMITGGWVESIYLAASVLKQKPLSAEMHSVIFDNAYTYQNVKKILEVFQNDCKDCKDVLIELETISAPVENLIVNSKYGITREQLDNLHTPLALLRGKLVS
jgi:hypothetical protein